MQNAIQLARGGVPGEEELTVGHVWGLGGKLPNLALVTLSACDAAFGERPPERNDVTSLANAFAYAGNGTTKVVASLWSVLDASTKETMVAFYEQLMERKSAAEALRNAQLKVMKDPRYNHPYYWAPFILMGDWR